MGLTSLNRAVSLVLLFKTIVHGEISHECVRHVANFCLIDQQERSNSVFLNYGFYFLLHL